MQLIYVSEGFDFQSFKELKPHHLQQLVTKSNYRVLLEIKLKALNEEAIIQNTSDGENENIQELYEDDEIIHKTSDHESAEIDTFDDGASKNTINPTSPEPDYDQMNEMATVPLNDIPEESIAFNNVRKQFLFLFYFLKVLIMTLI